jgi:hypothetical protein
MQAVMSPKEMVIARNEKIATTILGAYMLNGRLFVLFNNLKEYVFDIVIKNKLKLKPGNKLMDGKKIITPLLFDLIHGEAK